MIATNQQIDLTDELERLAPFLIKSLHTSDSLDKYLAQKYHLFLNSDDAAKEDLIIKWEQITKSLTYHSQTKPEAITHLLNGNAKRIDKIITQTNDFAKKLEREFYGDLNQPLSQEHLEELAKKFSHLPKDILDSLTND